MLRSLTLIALPAAFLAFLTLAATAAAGHFRQTPQRQAAPTVAAAPEVPGDLARRVRQWLNGQRPTLAVSIPHRMGGAPDAPREPMQSPRAPTPQRVRVASGRRVRRAARAKRKATPVVPRLYFAPLPEWTGSQSEWPFSRCKLGDDFGAFAVAILHEDYGIAGDICEDHGVRRDAAGQFCHYPSEAFIRGVLRAALAEWDGDLECGYLRAELKPASLAELRKDFGGVWSRSQVVNNHEWTACSNLPFRFGQTAWRLARGVIHAERACELFDGAFRNAVRAHIRPIIAPVLGAYVCGVGDWPAKGTARVLEYRRN